MYDIPSVLEHRKKNNSVVQVSSNAVREIILNSGHSVRSNYGTMFLVMFSAAIAFGWSDFSAETDGK